MNKSLRIALLVVFIPLIAASIAIAWLCYTASGLQFALLQLNHVPNLVVQVQGVTGRLAGPLHVDRIMLDHERIHIDIDQFDVDLTPAFLLSGLIEINRLQVGEVKATLKPRLKDTPDVPIHFLPDFLRISVDALELRRAEYVHTSGYTIVATPLQGSASLSRNRLRVTQLNAVTTEFDARGEVVLDSDAVLSLRADLNADYKLANGPVLRGEVKANGPVTGNARKLMLDALLHQPHEAAIKATLEFPDIGWLLQGNATADRVLLDAWWQQPTFSLSKLAMQFQLSPAGMHYVGDMVVPEWSPLPLHVDADTHYAQRVFTLERADVSVPRTGIKTRTTGTITLNTGAKPLLDLEGSWTGLQWPIHAAANQAWFVSSQGSSTLKGTMPYQFVMEGRVAAPQWPDSGVQARGELRQGAIQLASYQLQTLQGTASGTALIEFSPPRNWQFELTGDHLNPAGVQAAWPGSLDIKASGKGQGFDKKARFDVRLQSLTGTVRKQTVIAHGRLQRDGQRWLAEGIDAKWGGAHLTAQGVVGPQNNLSFALVAPQLQQLHPDVMGDINLDGQFSGPAATPLLRVRGKSTRLAYMGWEAQKLALDTRIDVTDGSDSHLELTAAALMSGANGMKNLLIKGDGRLIGHALSLEGSPVNAWLPEDLRLRIFAGAAYDNDIWHGMLDVLEVVDAKQNRRMALQEKTAWRVSRTLAQLQSLCVNVEGGRACAHMDWQRDNRNLQTWNAHADLQSLPLWIGNAALAPAAHLQTKLNGRLDFSASPDTPWQGSAELQLADASIRYQAITNREVVLPITLGELHLDANAAAVLTNAELRLGEQTVVSLGTKLDRSSGRALDSWPLSGVLSLSSSDAKLIPVFVNEVDRAQGTLAAVLQLTGTATDPRFAGSVRLLDGELDFYQLNLALRALQFDAQVDTDEVQFKATANAGEGVLNAEGNLNWRDAKLFGNLQLKGERLLVADLPEYRVYASPDLRFDIDNRNINVKGEVLIPEAQLQPKEVVGAVQTSADARFKTDEVFDAKRSPWIINSDVTIRLGDKVNFDGLGLQGQLGGSVNTRLRTGDIAVGSGELSVSSGRYEIYGQKLDIKRGRLIYDSTPLGDPGLDIQAERDINDGTVNTVGVNVRGVLRAPRLQFYSDPSMSQTQIVSYLLIGKPLDTLQSGEATTVRSASNTLALQGGGYLAAQLGRRIGLEQVGVETDAKNQSALVLGKFLSPRLFISYGISLTEAINTVKLRYSLSDHWTVKTEAGEAKSADIEFKIER